MARTGPRSSHDSQAFPYRQLTVLALCRLSEPIAFMSIFPYIYYMIKSFHITDSEERIALFVGMTISAFAFAEAISSWAWGRLSDKYGRKPILLSGLAGTGLSMLVFGFAPNIYVALLARALGGLLNGNIGVLQTTIAEVVKNEKHKSIGFALMPAVWCVGAAIGSGLGGTLADPVRSYPDTFRPGTILDRFPYLLPNLVCVGIVAVAIVVGILFLEETHEDLKEHRDYGLQIGRGIESACRLRSITRSRATKVSPIEAAALLLEGDPPPDYKSAAPSPSLQPTAIGMPPPYHSIDECDDGFENNKASNNDDIEASPRATEADRKPAGLWNAMTNQLLLNIIALGILAYHTISAEQLLPILFSMPESTSPPNLPFHFTGGFALPTARIGSILAIQGFIQMIATLLIFPAVQLHLGTLTTYRLVVLSYPALYILTPYLTLVPVGFRTPAIYALLIWKVTAQAFAFPSNNMMINNATPRKSLGLFNGVAQSSASLARAVGPTLSGLLEAKGLARGMLGLPWWVNALVAVGGAGLSLFMVETPQGGRAEQSEKVGEDAEEEDDGAVPPAISPEVDAALVAARSSSNLALDAMTMARSSSPVLGRRSVDARRHGRDEGKFTL